MSDGTWLLPNARTRCYGVGEAAKLRWDPVKECNLSACEGTQELKARLWNKDCEGAWREYLPDVDFGVK